MAGPVSVGGKAAQGDVGTNVLVATVGYCLLEFESIDKARLLEAAWVAAATGQ